MGKFPQRRAHNLNGGRPKKPDKKITVSIVMPPEMASSLRTQAAEQNVSLSEIVTRIIGGEEAPK